MFLYSIGKFSIYIKINTCNILDIKNGTAWFELPVCYQLMKGLRDIFMKGP